MTNVGIPEDEQNAVFQLVATVLHLGNLEFTEAGEHDSSRVVESSAPALEAAAKLLGAQSDGLARALTTRTRHTVDGGQLSLLCFCAQSGLQRHLQTLMKPSQLVDTDLQLPACRALSPETVVSVTELQWDSLSPSAMPSAVQHAQA